MFIDQVVAVNVMFVDQVVAVTLVFIRLVIYFNAALKVVTIIVIIGCQYAVGCIILDLYKDFVTTVNFMICPFIVIVINFMVVTISIVIDLFNVD